MRRSSDLDATIALTRFGLGARPGDIGNVASDARGWLEAQVRPKCAPNPPGAFTASTDRMRQFQAYQREAAEVRQARREDGSAPPVATMAGPAPMEAIIASPRARTRSRIASCTSSGTQTAVRPPARC